MTLYQSLADRLQGLISDQVYPVGSRLPGVRVLAEQQQVSVSTAVNACRELEQRGLLEARPRPGYYVRQPPVLREPPRAAPASRKPRQHPGQEHVPQLLPHRH